jgi:hypothetical protein
VAQEDTPEKNKGKNDDFQNHIHHNHGELKHSADVRVFLNE